ncbi:hypothetical protein BDZ45DRAFT_398805 [Acephala macrosclerotiorum]|nr:hypothetical protein BDZ45DRAFT_398805 [Acephala macrosclerotiorum]
MRFVVPFLSCASVASAFNFLPDIFRRQKRQQVCQVFTIIEYPCEVATWVASNTTLWIESCSTSVSITNAPTGLSTILTSTTTLGITTTTTVTLSLVTTRAAILTTVTLSGPAPTTSINASPTTRLTLTSGVVLTSLAASLSRNDSKTELLPSATTSIPSLPSSSCVPSSTNYPQPEFISANTTYIIEVTSPEFTAELSGAKVYLLSGGGITYNPDLAIQVFFYNGILFSTDPYFGVRWYATDVVGGYPIFAIQQYVANSQAIARDFSTAPGTMDLVWNNCEFANMDVIFQFEPVGGLILLV